METERLIIRKFEKNETDLLALFEIMSDVEVNNYLPWFPLKTLKEASVFFDKRILPSNENNQGYYFAICLKEDNRPIGYVTASGDDSHDFGYGLLKRYWHQGIVTETAVKMIEFLKEKKWQYITATHDINNPNSGKVMEKVSMTYKYSYQENWQPKNKLVTFRMYQLNFDGVERTYDKYWHQYEEHFIEKFN